MSTHRSVKGAVVLSAMMALAISSGSAAAYAAYAAPNAASTGFLPAEEQAVEGQASAATAGRQEEPPSRLRGLALSLGVRTDLVRSRAFDPFSTSDDLQQSSLGARYFHASELGVGFGVGVAWDHGSSTATARSAATALTLDRLSLTLEGRAPLSRHFTALARVAPGWLRRATTLTDGSLPNAPYATASAGTASQIASSVSADASVGMEFLVGRLQTATLPVVGLSLLADGGYSYAPAREVVFSSASTGGGGRTDQPVRFGKLAIGGVFFRLAAAVLF
jgi:hypothetical protein